MTPDDYNKQYEQKLTKLSTELDDIAKIIKTIEERMRNARLETEQSRETRTSQD